MASAGGALRALVTGGAGFIGSHLVRGCLERGYEVRVVDDFSTGRRENLAGLEGDVEVVEGSVTDLETLRRLSMGCATLFHLAALPSVPLSVEDPVRTHVVNATGTLHALEAARQSGLPRVVYASSCAIYGKAEQMPISEEMPARPASPYALQKYLGELYAERFVELYGLEVVSLRYFNVYGPRQSSVGGYAAVIPQFLEALAKGEPPNVHGDGGQSRDFVYVRDVVEATLSAAGAPANVSGRVFNVGCGKQVSILDLLDAVARAVGREEVRPEFAPSRPGDLRHSVADVRSSADFLGWRARTPLDAGLADTARFSCGQGDS
jgi:UDP-glucose 4-epimerase